ncbi:MAG: 30S ribosomal protein S21 [Candidatus Pacebacteria bacterium]|nr:30S ribosomal protein S21 [Candidatus Paceibacterota bacterium]
MKKFSNFDRKLRTFKRKVQRSGVLEEHRNRMHYTKPTTRRRNALNAAKRREYNRRINDELPSRTNRLY